MLSIRNASPEDIPLIQELNLKIWPQTYSAILSKEQMAYMLDMMYSDKSLEKQFAEGHNFIICYSNNELVGFASWSEMEPGGYKLHKIYILPQQQGSGIGRYMVNYIIGELEKVNGIHLDLNVNKYNKAKFFYEKLGFEVIREEDIDIGNGYFMNDYVLRYKLPGY